jgi:2-haloacid dehalogenase
MTTRIKAVAFDLGGVLIDWNPRHLYRRLLDDEAAIERFLAEVCTPEWNATLDAGQPFADGVAQLIRKHPAQAELIEAYRLRWPEMLGGCFPETLEIMRRLREEGMPVYALSNWAAETFPSTRDQFPFLDEFDGILLSGEIGVGKPDPAIFRLFLERFELSAEATVFIDDSPANVAIAGSLGIQALLFQGAAQLEQELRALGLPV